MQLIKDVERFITIFRVDSYHAGITLPVIALNANESYCIRQDYGDDHPHARLKVMSDIVAYRLVHGNHPVVHRDDQFRIVTLDESYIESVIKPDRTNWPEWALTALAAGWTAPKGWKP